MGRSSKKRGPKVTPKQAQEVTVNSLEHVVTAPSQPVTRDDNYLPRLADTWMLHAVDFDHGLLEELLRLGVINHEKFETFSFNTNNGNSSIGDRVQLMNDVINASTEQKDQFLLALDKTQQSHVTNWIRHNGQRPADTDDNWPSFDGYRVINEHLLTLTNLIDLECGLLDEIISAGFLSDGQRAAVSARRLADRSTVRELLLIMRRKSVADHKLFLGCLVKTKQCRVVSLLDPSTAANCPPISEGDLAKLDANQSALVELIDTGHRFLLKLEAADCLTFRQRSCIESADNKFERARRLLEILRRGSQLDYDNFILCLGTTEQRQAFGVLSVAAVTVSQITAHGTEVDRYQSFVVNAFKNLLQNSSELTKKEIMLQVFGPDNELILLKTTQSITLFIASRSLPAQIHLYDMYSNKQLQSVIQQLFRELIASEQDVVIDELVWDRLDYSRNVQHLAEAFGLSVYSKIYQYALATTTGAEPSVCSVQINKTPHELIEIMLMKAASQLFVSLRKMTTNAHMYTLVNLSAVSRYWWQTLTYRRSNTRRLRRHLTRLSHPFTYNPRLLTYLQVEGRKVNGVVGFDSKLYVTIFESNTIDVYDLADCSSYKLIERIKVPDLLDSYDLVVSSSARCLFASDYNARCIRRINLSRDSDVADQTDRSPFIENLQYTPCNLSVQSERLLVSPYDGDALYVYNINDVEKSQRINLPDYMLAKHAVETSRGTFVVAHQSKSDDDPPLEPKGGVSELATDGRVLRVYKGPTPFGWPYYMTTFNGHFLVSDIKKRQILHLNPDLELTQILIADKFGNPLTHHYNPEARTLHVTHENSSTVTIYNI